MPPGSSSLKWIERQLAVGRVALASFSLFAVCLDRTEPSRYGVEVRWLLAGYLLYALLVAAATFRARDLSRYRTLRDLIDVGITFAVVRSAGINSPLFPLVVFVLFTATRRWERRIAVWVTAGILGFFLVLGILAGLSYTRTLELNDFLLRAVALTLALVAAFLLSVATDETRIRARMERLATPPAMTPQPLDALLGRLLEWAVGVMGAQRAVLVWEDVEEPWLHLVEWRTGEFRRARESPESMAPLVAPDLGGDSFLGQHVGHPDSVILRSSTTGTRRWHGSAVHPLLSSRFSMNAVLSLVFSREYVKGRLFLLDMRDMTPDDLAVGEVVVRDVASRLNYFHLRQDLAEAELLEERLRLARDLHDSAFHVFTGVAMQLEYLLRVPESELAASTDRIGEIRDSLVEGQRTMREMIDSLRLGPEPTSGLGLEARVKGLVERSRRWWRLDIQYTITDCDDLPRAIVDEIWLMVHEALVNVGRHACAAAATISVTASDGGVKIIITDDGRGFGFTGRYEHDTLVVRQIGPWSLKQRAAALGGRIAIQSGLGRTVVEVRVPIRTAREGVR